MKPEFDNQGKTHSTPPEDTGILRYTNARQSDPQPVFLLETTLSIAWENETAEALAWPPQYLQAYFSAESLEKKLEQSLKKTGFYVRQDFTDQWILLLTPSNLPSKRLYLEASLWPKTGPPPMPGSIPPKSPWQTSRAMDLLLKTESLEKGYFHAPTKAVSLHSFFNRFASILTRLLSLKGIGLKTTLDLEHSNMLTQPEALTEAVGLLVSQTVSQCLPGDNLLLKISGDSVCLEMKLERAGEQGRSPPLPPEASPEIQLSKKLARWLGGTLEGSTLTLPKRLALKQPDIQPFDYEKNLIRLLSQTICMEKLCPCFFEAGFTQNWRLFDSYNLPMDAIGSSIEAIRERLEQYDYRDVYGWNPAMNLSALRKLQCLGKHAEIALSGLSHRKHSAVLSRNNQTPPENVESLSSLYGLTAAQMNIPKFLLKAMAGTLTKEQMDPTPNARQLAKLIMDGKHRYLSAKEIAEAHFNKQGYACTPQQVESAIEHLNSQGISCFEVITREGEKRYSPLFRLRWYPEGKTLACKPVNWESQFRKQSRKEIQDLYDVYFHEWLMGGYYSAVLFTASFYTLSNPNLFKYQRNLVNKLADWAEMSQEEVVAQMEQEVSHAWNVRQERERQRPIPDSIYLEKAPSFMTWVEFLQRLRKAVGTYMTMEQGYTLWWDNSPEARRIFNKDSAILDAVNLVGL